MSAAAITIEIVRLINVRTKLKDGDYITTREENDVSSILGVPKFINKREMADKIDDFFTWLAEILKKNNSSSQP
jgi:hypothetical protein